MSTHLLDYEAPTVNPSGAPPNDYQRIDATPDAFGASIGKANVGLGQAVEGAGVAGLDILTARQDLQDEIHSSEVSTDLNDKITNKFSEFGKLQGSAAYYALPRFKSDIADLNKQAIGAAGNLKSQAMIAKSGSYMVDQYNKIATGHADREFDRWQQDTASRRATSMGGQATIMATQGDFKAFDAFMVTSNDEIRKQKESVKGYEPDALAVDLQKNTGAHVANTVEQLAIAGTNGSPNLSLAKGLFDKYKGQMDADSVLKVEKWLAPRILQDQAQKNANLIVGGPGLMPGAGGQGEIAGPGHGRGSINAAYTAPLDQTRVAGGPSPESLFTYLQAHGGTRNEALMLTSSAASEGVFNPNALHDRDANGNPTGYGLFGHRLDRRDAMFAATGTNRPSWEQQAQFALQELRSRPEASLVNAATTPVELANAEMHFEQPRAYSKNDPQAGENYNGRLNTIRRFTQLAAGGDVTEASGAMPMLDKSAAVDKAISLTDGNPALRAATISEINRRYSQYGAATSTERQALSLDVPNKIEAAENGVTITDFPEARIRAVFPSPKAQAMIDQFAIAQRVGATMHGIQFATQEEVDGAARDIESGQGHLSEMMKSHARFETTGPGAIGADANDEMNGAYFKLRSGAAKKLQDVITQRSKMLVGPSADPATYVMDEPSVSKAYAAAAKDPSKIADYVNASLGVQAHVGVPDEQQHVMTRQLAMGMSQKLQSSGDVRGELAALQKQFGPHYQRVFSDLVQLGKLPSSYQAVAALPDADDAKLLARALQQAPGTEEDGKKAESWNERIVTATGDAKTPQTIRDSINTSTPMRDYVQTLKRQGLSAPMIDNIQHDVQTLAFAKVYWNKQNAATAADGAVEAFTKHFEIAPGGDYRVPADVADAVGKDSDDLVANLKKENITMPREIGGVARATGDDFIRDVRRNHSWMNTPRGDGITLLDGIGRYVLDKQGQPITVPFSTAGHISQTSSTVRHSALPGATMGGP